MTVLVVGAGPAGLTTAVTLARYGVDTLLVERRPEPSTLPRATSVSTRTMELVRSWGLEDLVRARGVDVRWQAWVTASLASPDGAAVDLGYPDPDLAARHSPTSPACVAQDAFEAVLLDYLSGLPNVKVRRGTEVVSVLRPPGTDSDESAAGGLEVWLRDVVTGETSACRPTHVVAADGAHSRIRRAFDIEMDAMHPEVGLRGVHGSERVGALSTLFEAPLWDVVGQRRYGIYSITNPAASGVLLPAGQDRWIFGQDIEPGSAPPPLDATVARLRAATGVARLEPTVLRQGTFTFDARLARRYRQGNVFLVGDAAHRITPRGGTGMNTAVHDGHDLGWKLAWVLLGWAGPELLDSYEAERRPVGHRNTLRSAQPDGSFRDPVDELAADLGGRVPHAWLTSRKLRTSTLDVLGPGLTLFVGPQAGPGRIGPGRDVLDNRTARRLAPAGGVADPASARMVALDGAVSSAAPVEVYWLDAETAQLVGVPSGGSLLLRPDGKPAVSAGNAAADRLADLPGALAAATR